MRTRLPGDAMVLALWVFALLLAMAILVIVVFSMGRDWARPRDAAQNPSSTAASLAQR
jgi:hypothetical protein